MNSLYNYNDDNKDLIKIYNLWEIEEKKYKEYKEYKDLELVLFIFYSTLLYFYYYNLQLNCLVFLLNTNNYNLIK